MSASDPKFTDENSGTEFKIGDRIWYGTIERPKMTKYKITGYVEWDNDVTYVGVDPHGGEGIILRHEATARGRTKRERKLKEKEPWRYSPVIDVEIGDPRTVSIQVFKGKYISTVQLLAEKTTDNDNYVSLTRFEIVQLRDALNNFLHVTES